MKDQIIKMVKVQQTSPKMHSKKKQSKKVKKVGSCEKKSYDASSRPYNCYNLFYILERELCLQSSGVETWKTANTKETTDSSGSGSVQEDDVSTDYSDLEIPSLPPRYQSLILQNNWFVHGKRNMKKRPHVKTHGVHHSKILQQLLQPAGGKLMTKLFNL